MMTINGKRSIPVTVKLQPETEAELDKVPIRTVAYSAMLRGVQRAEPLLVGLDGLLRYAKAYRDRWERPLAQDAVLGPAWLDCAKGYRALLNGDGAVAWEGGFCTDSKDNGSLDGVFWAALALSGFGEGDL